MIPKGQGVYLWRIPASHDGDVVKIANSLEYMNIQWVAIKIADGRFPFNVGIDNSGRYYEKNLPALVDELRKRGIGVHGWQYIYLYSPSREAEMLARRAMNFNMDSIILDPEGEAKNKKGMAKEYVNTLSSIWKGDVGLSSYRFPSLHRELPWAEFLSCSTYHAPQVYWLGGNNPAAQLQKSIRELKALKDIPFVPAGSAYSEHGWTPKDNEIEEFASEAQKTCRGWLWWELSYILRKQNWIEIIKKAGESNVSNEEKQKKEESTTMSYKVVAKRGLRLRTLPNTSEGTDTGKRYKQGSIIHVIEIVDGEGGKWAKTNDGGYCAIEYYGSVYAQPV